MAAELTPAHLDDMLWTHPEAFRVLLAPSAETSSHVEASHVRRAAEVAATATDVVVLHLPHAIDDYAYVGFETADRIVEVLTLDVLSFRSSKRAVDALRPIGIDGRLGFVVNRASRAEITQGRRPRVRVRAAGGGAQGSSRCSSAGSRAPGGRAEPYGRAFDRLAGALGVA